MYFATGYDWLGDQAHHSQRRCLAIWLTTVAYAARPDYILNANWIFEGKLKAVLVPTERAVDIDTELDLAFAEYLLTEWQASQPKIGGNVPEQLWGEHSCDR